MKLVVYNSIKTSADILCDNILVSNSTDMNSRVDLFLLLIPFTSCTFTFCFVGLFFWFCFALF